MTLAARRRSRASCTARMKDSCSRASGSALWPARAFAASSPFLVLSCLVCKSRLRVRGARAVILSATPFFVFVISDVYLGSGLVPPFKAALFWHVLPRGQLSTSHDHERTRAATSDDGRPRTSTSDHERPRATHERKFERVSTGDAS